MRITKNDTFFKNCYDIILENESYTIGKIIEHVLFSDCVESETPTLSFVSFLKDHPHNSFSLVRIVYIDDESEQDLIELLHDKFKYIIQIFEHIDTQL